MNREVEADIWMCCYASMSIKAVTSFTDIELDIMSSL